MPCLTWAASWSLNGIRSGSDTGLEPRIFTGTAPSFKTKCQGGPDITRHTPSNTRGTSAMSDDRSAFFCSSDGCDVDVDEIWLMRACGYLVWSMPSFRWVSEQRTGCCRSSRTYSVVATGQDNPSSASQSIVAANDPTQVMAFPVAVRAATPGRSGISGNEMR